MEDLEEVGSSVSFLYKTMLERDPSKRRVKPVQDHMLQLDFAGLEDSSDDSDFEVPKGKDSADSDSGDNEIVGTSESGDEDSDKSDDDDEDEQEDTVRENQERSSKASESHSKINIHPLAVTEEDTRTSTGSVRKIKVVICAVCMGDRSGEDDEIVECDGCGVTVHEGCYGVVDTQSVASTESSASTEPWFCDACKAGIRPSCILCPNTSGIFKETDTGQWAHVVCALYIPGVTFGDVDKLAPITLFELHQSKWGSKACTLCEDIRYSRTGVCLGCDAGMCRAYFHVTCAQRDGLLSEASPDEEIADPFFAYCKQHADKNSARIKRRNFMAMQSNMKQHAEQEISEENEKRRVYRKLQKHKQKYELSKADRPEGWVTTEKHPRMLTTSASAMKKLLQKATLMGIDTDSAQTSCADVRRMWHIPPAFSVEFVSYFIDRNKRIEKMKTNLKDLLNTRETFESEEKTLRAKYEKRLAEANKLKDEYDEKRTTAEKMWNVLQAISEKPLSLPELLVPKKVVKSTSRKNLPRSSLVSSVIHSCGLCVKTTDQHLLAKCDICKLYYHLGCLDPPLTRMPKKSKLYGWQCSECVKSSSDEDSKTKKINTNAPMRLRQTIKEPIKFTPPALLEKRKCEKPRARPRREEVKKVLNLLSEPPMVSEITPEIEEPSPPKSTPEKSAPSSGSEVTPTTGSGKKKRGRPPKNRDADPESSTVPPQPEGLETPKKRGRPPKKRLEDGQTPMLENMPDLSQQSDLSDEEMDMPVLERESPIPVPTSDPIPNSVAQKQRRGCKKPSDVRTLCCVCSLPGDNNNLVRCDNCKLCFHFACLDPPCKKSPKQRGYTWHCHICDNSDSDNSNEDVKKPIAFPTPGDEGVDPGSSKDSRTREDSDDVIVIDLDSLPDSTDSAIEAKLDEVCPKQKDHKKAGHKKDTSAEKGLGELVLGKRVPKETPKAAQARLEAMYRQQNIARKHNKQFRDEFELKEPEGGCEKLNERSEDMPPLHGDTGDKLESADETSSKQFENTNCLKPSAAPGAEQPSGPPCLERIESSPTQADLSSDKVTHSEICDDDSSDESPNKRRKISTKNEKDSELVTTPTESETCIQIQREYLEVPVSPSDMTETITETMAETLPNSEVDRSAANLNTDLPLKRKYMKRANSGANAECPDSQPEGHHSLASLDEREREAKKPKKSAVSSAFVMGQMKFSAPSKEDRKLMKQNRESKNTDKGLLFSKKMDGKNDIPKIVPPLPNKDNPASSITKIIPILKESKHSADVISSVTQKDCVEPSEKVDSSVMSPAEVSNSKAALSARRESQETSPTRHKSIDVVQKTETADPNEGASGADAADCVEHPEHSTHRGSAAAGSTKTPASASAQPKAGNQSPAVTSSGMEEFCKPDMSPVAAVKCETSSTASSAASSPPKKTDSDSKPSGHRKHSHKRGRPSTSFDDIDAFVEKFDLPSLKHKHKHSRHHKRSESGEEDGLHGKQESTGHYVTNFKKKHSKKRKDSSSLVDIDSLVGQFDSKLELPSESSDDKESSSEKECTNDVKTSPKLVSPVLRDNPFASEKILGDLHIRKKIDTISIPKMNSKSCFVKRGAMDRNNLSSSGKLFQKTISSPGKDTFSSRESDSSRSSCKSNKLNNSKIPVDQNINSMITSQLANSNELSKTANKATSHQKSAPACKSSKNSKQFGGNLKTNSLVRQTTSTTNSASKTSSSHKPSKSNASSFKSVSKPTHPVKQNVANSSVISPPPPETTIKTPQTPPAPKSKNKDSNSSESTPVKKDEESPSDSQPNDISPKSQQEMTYEEFKRTLTSGTFKTSPIKSSEVPLKKRGRKQGLNPRADAAEILSSPDSASSKSPDSLETAGQDLTKHKTPPSSTANMSVKKRFKFSFLKGTKDGEDVPQSELPTNADITNGSVKKSVP